MPSPVPAPPLRHWLYVSDCLLPLSWADRAVADIVAVSRARNAALDVTGALLFTGRRFAQFIEGPAEPLAILRAGIEADARHAAIRTIRDGSQKSRLFDDWSLAYAGPSLFVSGEVDAAFDDAERLVRMLREFASPS